VALLPAGFTPSFAHSAEMIENNNLQFFCFVGLVQNSLDHRDAFIEIIIFFSCQKDVKGLVLSLVRVVHFGLASFSANANFAFAFLFKFLLGRA
jgi:hypothetical protein